MPQEPPVSIIPPSVSPDFRVISLWTKRFTGNGSWTSNAYDVNSCGMVPSGMPMGMVVWGVCCAVIDPTSPTFVHRQCLCHFPSVCQSLFYPATYDTNSARRSLLSCGYNSLQSLVNGLAFYDAELVGGDPFIQNIIIPFWTTFLRLHPLCPVMTKFVVSRFEVDLNSKVALVPRTRGGDVKWVTCLG